MKNLILILSSLITSRTLFFFFDDPEGPNLLIVVVMAIVLFTPSYFVYFRYQSANKLKRISLAIFAQILLATILFFFMQI